APLGLLIFSALCQIPVMFWASSVLPGRAESANIDSSRLWQLCIRQLFMRHLLYEQCISGEGAIVGSVLPISNAPIWAKVPGRAVMATVLAREADVRACPYATGADPRPSLFVDAAL